MTLKPLVTRKDIQKCGQILTAHHYLHSAKLVGEQLRSAVSWKGQWLAVATWSAPALHLKARDRYIVGGPRSNGANAWPWWSTMRACTSCRNALIPTWSAGL
jgi:hypothetical protein